MNLCIGVLVGVLVGVFDVLVGLLGGLIDIRHISSLGWRTQYHWRWDGVILARNGVFGNWDYVSGDFQLCLLPRIILKLFVIPFLTSKT